ncbi:MAG: fibronectin type protein, partial [Microbacteriaceae bacterium]|nr:fibronectin type protein [Microbacteriaceae bacterium]
VISDVDPINESIGRLDLINDRQQVQITLVSGASGSVAFHYSISDGRGGTASATVTVTVRQPSENSPPQQVRQTKALVASGARVTSSVLGDWVDPDGDAFYLASAETAIPDAVSYKPEGSVVFSEGGAASSLRSVVLVVSDGRANGTGSMTVTVKPAGEVPIIADPFVVLTYAGQEITVSPLDHVRGGTGTLRLASVPAKTGATISASLDAGTFRFSSDQVGTHYLEYVVNDGDQTVTGILRVEVAAPPDANTRPITIPKTVFVKTLSSETVDVASTDIDPAGGVLLVTSVYNVAANSGVRAESIEQRAVRVTLTAPLESGPVSFNYRISNGLADAEGLITVVEIPRPARLQPPVAGDDAVTVRTGDAIDIHVLDNDVQPDGEELTLNPLLSTGLQGGSGLLFASGNVLRYLAPNKTGDFTAVYQVSGPDGQVAQAQVKISVREAVEATNNPPVPVTVTGRVLAGETARIAIPLNGIDPDGDSVQLLGQETSPEKGSVTQVGTDYIDYEAGDYSAGTDTFTYSVVDALGARATGTVRVGISPKHDGARNPVAIEDEATIRPGGTVSVQVLANDSDPDGGTLKVTKVEPNTRDIKATIVGDVVKVTPPRAPGRYGLVYTIENEFGGTSSNFITVVVDPNAQRAYPIADDTVLTLTDVLGQQSVNVNVLQNVFFADGEVSALKVSLLPGYSTSATVTAGKRIRVEVLAKSQIIPFAVAHPDDPSIVSYAFVWVPGLDDALPQLNRRAPALAVASEAEIRIDLNDYVLATGGKTVRLTDITSVKATHSDGGSLVVNDHTLRFTSADKYFGPASISFEVTDGSSATDPNGRKATLVLPIKVTPRQNQPPVFVGGVIDFEPAQSKQLDLLKLTNYPYPDDVGELAYAVIGSLPDGFSYTLTGQTLVLRADEDAKRGTTSSLALSVRDDLSAGQSGRIQLNVVASSRPLARPAPDSAIATRGQSTSVDVLANDEATNPFPGQPLKVVAIRGLDGANLPEGVSVTPSADRSRLAINISSAALPGDTNLQYEVADATGDPDRYVWGSVRISVQDRPDAVANLAASAFGNKSITLRWNPGNSNNSAITGYQVLMFSPSQELLSTTACTATVCDVTTQGNGPSNAVRFRVTATNAIGTSDPASMSDTIWSDVIPAAPAGLAATPLDGGLHITWTPTPDPAGGSPVNSYVVLAGSASATVTPSSCTTSCAVDVSGLSNGQAVTVSVSARNGAYAALAAWNSSIVTGVPAGPPLIVGAPSATATDTAITVDWAGAFADNGRAITDYRAVAYTGAQPSCPASGDGTATSATISASSDSVYSIVVFAWNAQGCTASAPVVAHTPPAVVTDADAGLPGQHGENFDLVLAAVRIGGTTLSADYSFYYSINGGAEQPDPISSGGFISGAPYGAAVTIALRACRNFSDGATACQATPSAPIALAYVAVDPHVTGVSFAAGATQFDAGTFTWLSTPAGYDAVEYSCGAGFLPADPNPGGTCSVSPLISDPLLTIRVTANGGQTYDIKYDQNGNVRP